MVGLFAAATLFTAITYHIALRTSVNNAAAVTQTAMSGLMQSYGLLDRLSSSQSALQSVLREKDPDVIEKALKQLEQSQKETKEVIVGLGESGREILKQFSLLVPQQKAVVDQVLLGNAGMAYEKFLAAYNPQHETLLKEVDLFNSQVQKETNARLTSQQRATRISLLWRGCTVAAVLIALIVIGSLMKNRIASQLQMLAAKLGLTSDTQSSSLIASNSQSLAEGAGTQATSIEETSVSLEKISGMTKRNAENAAAAKDLSRETREAAETGSTNIQSMNLAMEEIQSASSNIAKIIKTIDEIAFQTNILALNAAVEAARAGEAGAGFAVVADEVRNLARRSADAAKETAQRIESSIAKSANGVAISGRVTESLALIVKKARKVDDFVAEIANASREQSQGLDQVNDSVSQMDKVTQSNAASAEEIASASEGLSAQSATLRGVVSALQKLVTGSDA